MNKLIYLLITVLLVACSPESKTNAVNPANLKVDNLIIRDRIDGPANVRETVNGNLRLKIVDNTLVECGQLKNNWYQIGLFTELKFEETDNGVIKKGTKILDEAGELIAIAKSDIDDWIFNEEDGIYSGLIEGYTHQKNIKPASIVEKALEQILNSQEALTLPVFNQHLKEFQYEAHGLKVDGYDDLKQYMIYGSWLEDPSPIDRVRLMFANDSLVAVIHERPLKMKGKKSYPLDRGLKILIVKNFEAEELKDFITKNKKSYYGVD